MSPTRKRLRLPRTAGSHLGAALLVSALATGAGAFVAVGWGAPLVSAFAGAASSALLSLLFVISRAPALRSTSPHSGETEPESAAAIDRRPPGAAWREDREALVETLSAEIAHEVRYPINFFRSIFVRAADNPLLDKDDVAIGHEEVERLERLVSGLRRAAVQRVDRRIVQVAELCSRAEALVRDRVVNSTMILDVADDDVIRCDIDKITQVLVNLLDNALDAVGQGGEVGMSFHRNERGAELTVWDNGPGFGDNAARLFAPWYTTKPRGTGLGLAISHRLVRGHGWNDRGRASRPKDDVGGLDR